MIYIIYYKDDFTEIEFQNTSIHLNSLQCYVKLNDSELEHYLDYKFYSHVEIKRVIEDVLDENGDRTEKLYLSRSVASQDPQAYNIFLQDYFTLASLGTLGEQVFYRALPYNEETFSQWFGILNLEGKFFRAVVGSFAIVLKTIPSEGGGITESQRKAMDFLLRPMMNDVYTGNWRTAAEYWYLGYPDIQTNEFPNGIRPIKEQIEEDLSNQGKTPEEVAAVMANFTLLEMQLDSYLLRFYKDENGNPLVINPNPIP